VRFGKTVTFNPFIPNTTQFKQIALPNDLCYKAVLFRMPSSGMLRRVAFVRTDVLEELSASFIRMTRIGELRTPSAVTDVRLLVTASHFTDSCHPDAGGAKVLRNVDSYKSHTA
jgi:hypothetical protein